MVALMGFLATQTPQKSFIDVSIIFGLATNFTEVPKPG